MGIFDFIPTIPEVIGSAICITFGHQYDPVYSKGKLLGYVCSNCGKVKP